MRRAGRFIFPSLTWHCRKRVQGGNADVLGPFPSWMIFLGPLGFRAMTFGSSRRSSPLALPWRSARTLRTFGLRKSVSPCSPAPLLPKWLDIFPLANGMLQQENEELFMYFKPFGDPLYEIRFLSLHRQILRFAERLEVIYRQLSLLGKRASQSLYD